MMHRRIAPNVRRRRSSLVRAMLGLTITTAAITLVPSTTAQADPGAVYFRSGGTDCVLHDNGSFTCGLSMTYSGIQNTIKFAGVDIPVPFGINQVSYGLAGLPAHPSFGAADEYTVAGGNPDISAVATSGDMWGPTVEYGGTKCTVGFHGSFTCTSQGHGFTAWGGNLSMS